MVSDSFPFSYKASAISISNYSGPPSAFTQTQGRALLHWLHSTSHASPLPFPSNFLTSLNTFVHAKKFGYGQSNPTYLITLHSTIPQQAPCELVLRAQPAGKLLPGAHRLDREYKVLRALFQTEVPVPNVYAFCADGADVLPGRQFYVMQYVRGEIFHDMSMSHLTGSDGHHVRAQAFREAVRVLRLLSAVDPNTIGLGALSRPSPSWFRRQVDTWHTQILRSELPGIDYSTLHALHAQLISHPVYNDSICSSGNHHTNKGRDSIGLVHGDFRLDNLVFQRDFRGTLKCVAVLDWELVALGNPLADLAQFLTPFHMPPVAASIPILQATALPVPSPRGIPSENDIVALYHANRDTSNLHDLPAYIAVSLFRIAGVLAGVLSRARQGNASSKVAEQLGSQLAVFAEGGLHVLKKSNSKYDQKVNVKRSGEDVEWKLKQFMEDEVTPLEDDYFAHVSSDRRWYPWMPLEELKEKAKKAELWNLFLPKALGGQLTNEEYAPLAAIMGKSIYASEVFNCSAPDTGNMELLARYGTPEQKERWLRPLLNGEIRSCFGMTEPEVASSDATNLQTKIERQGEDFVVNGRKWWTSGAMDKRCKVMLLIARGPIPFSSSSSAQRHRQHSVLLIPMNTPGLRIIRHLTVFGYDDAPHGHAEVELSNVRVRARDALLHTEGGGFEAAQSRLGGGRLHHCMRMVGVSDRAVQLMVARAATRSAFGHDSLLQNDHVVQQIGECRADTEAMRAIVISAARTVDSGDKKAARKTVATAKIIVPRMAMRVLDRAVQLHGGMGVCQDTVLGMMYAHARTLRIADGPDEVHVANIAKEDVRRVTKMESSRMAKM